MAKKRKADASVNRERDDDGVSSLDNTHTSMESFVGKWNIIPIQTNKIGGDFQVWVNRFVVLAAQFVIDNEGKDLMHLPDLTKAFDEFCNEHPYFTGWVYRDKLDYEKGKEMKLADRDKYKKAVLKFITSSYSKIKTTTPWAWEWKDDVVWYDEGEQFFVEFPSSREEVKIMLDNSMAAKGIYAKAPVVPVEKVARARLIKDECKLFVFTCYFVIVFKNK